MRNEITQYAIDVLDGKYPAGQLHRLACERHIKDLETGEKRGIWFDLQTANRAITFFTFLKHTVGEWAGQSFYLQPWQKFIVGNLFGWKRSDGLRRFRTAYISTPRKNGKTTLLSGIALYLLIADGEHGAEIYSAATKRDQARIVFSEAVRMVLSTPSLKKRLIVYRNKIYYPDTFSHFEPLSSDANSLDGLNIHGGIIDELHAHKTRLLWDVLETATSARRQPLIIAITTAGTDTTSICYEQFTYAEQILKGTVQDDTYFAFIASADPQDDIFDPKTWIKANPNYGVTVKPDDLERKAEKARYFIPAQHAFMRLHLNLWVTQETRWLDLSIWDSCGGIVKEEELAGKLCFGGLDLSAVSDITAWVLVFPNEETGKLDILPRFWIPEGILRSHHRYSAQYYAWVREGYLRVTPGDTIDYKFIIKQILEDAKKFKIHSINIDRLFEGYAVGQELVESGLNVFGMSQTYKAMTVPLQELERRIYARALNHGNNPILRWMVEGAVIRQDATGNKKIDKANSTSKVDGIIALLMAIDRQMRYNISYEKSVYNEKGLTIL